MARWMASLGTLSFFAFSTAANSRAFIAGSEPPILAARVISRTSLVLVRPFLSPATSRFASSHWRPIVRGNIPDAKRLSPALLQKDRSDHQDADRRRHRPAGGGT